MNTKYANIDNNDTRLSVNCLTADSLDKLAPYKHIHDEIELVYVKQGSISLHIDSSVQVIEENQLIIINRLTAHEFFEINSAKYILLQFKPTMLYENDKMIDIKYLKPFFHTQEFSFYTGPCVNSALSEIVSVMSEIEQQIKFQQFAYDIVVQSDLIRLIYLMYKAQIFNSKIVESVKQKQNLQQLATLLEYINSHYNELITLEQACSITKLDYYYFSRIFKEKTGKTFVEYLSFIRILNAQKLLCETNYPVAMIAESVGFPNISYFNRIFKKQNGVTPIQYRSCKGILTSKNAYPQSR